MANLYDILYAAGVTLTAPVWGLRAASRRKVRRAFKERFGHDAAQLTRPEPAVMIHAVSLGEVNATTSLVQQLLARNECLHLVISTTTDTGFARAHELYGSSPRVSVIHYPLDFSSAILRVLNAFRFRTVVLMELEVWPNFTLHCARLGIPVLLMNGRLTDSSFKKYRRARPFVRRMFQRLALVCAQEPAYAERFIDLGVPRDRVKVTGTMKFDTAQVADRIDGAETLSNELGLAPDHPILVAGSTGPGEEEIALRTYRRLCGDFPNLRLVIVPRHPQRFDEVAGLITAAGFSLLRRSNPSTASSGKLPPVILGDTMGELRKFYSLATVVFVGRSLVDLGERQHGSDMIEPAALAKPVVVGPFTGNFADVMRRFREASAIAEVKTEQNLFDVVHGLLSDPARAASLGAAAQAVVRSSQGATLRHVDAIEQAASLER